MSQIAILSEDTVCITANGRAGTVPFGVYEITEIDGGADNAVHYITVATELVAIHERSVGMLVLEQVVPEAGEQCVNKACGNDATVVIDGDALCDTDAGFVAARVDA